MFQKDHIPILIDLPNTLDYADIYFIHDVHYGSELFDDRKWEELKNKILADDKAYVCWVGDLMENAIPNSKSDMFTQKHSPAEQKEWVTRQLKDFSHKTLAVVPAGVDDKYRNTIAFLDIGIGFSKNNKRKQVHYFGQIQHKAKDLKNYHSSDYTDGIDFFASGHDHETKDRPRAKMVFDKHNKVIYKRNIECLNCGSFCLYGGYGSENAYRPQSDKMYKLRIYSNEKRMETTGFYL